MRTPNSIQLGPCSCRGVSLIEILVVLVIVAVLAAFLIPAVQSRMVEASAAQSISNLRTLGIAMLSYRAENDGYGPPYVHNRSHPYSEGHNDWGIRQLRRYYRDGPRYIRQANGDFIPEPVESCPLRNRFEGRTIGLGYAIAPGMDRVKAALIANAPTKTPMIWQDTVNWSQNRSSTSNPLKLVYRDRGIYAAFMDGSVQFIPGTREDGRLFWGWWDQSVRLLNTQDSRLGLGNFFGEGEPR